MKFLILAMAFMPSFGLLGAARRRATVATGPVTGPGATTGGSLGLLLTLTQA